MQTTTTGPIEAILTEYRHVRETPALEIADADASDRHDNAIIDRLTETHSKRCVRHTRISG